jgi:hypothetical protein
MYNRNTAKFTLWLDKRGVYGKLFLFDPNKKGAGHEDPQETAQNHANGIPL